MRPEDVPTERLVRNASAVVAADPKRAENHYTLARIHYLAFSRATRTVPAYMSGKAPRIPSDYLTAGWFEMKRWERADELARAELGIKRPEVPSAPTPAFEAVRQRHLQRLADEDWRPSPEIDPSARAGHAIAALASFREALRLKPDTPLYVLGLASLNEEIAGWKKTVPQVPPDLAAIDATMAQADYLRAFRLAYVYEGKIKELGIEGLYGLVSYEAGAGYLRLATRTQKGSAATDSQTQREVEAALGKMKDLRQGIVTPIVFALRPASGIDELLAPDARVTFDLRGYGPAERWSWLKPATALLVWDPSREGRIMSGRQLFGGYTFQIFRATGYDALAALDDDGDGELRGAELAGLRVWFDENADGRCEPTEVRDLAALGIVGLAVKATAVDGIHPSNPHGLLLGDGRRLPTWDWIVAPARD